MLLEFKIKNYKSFKEEAVLSLTPAPKQKDLEYSLLKSNINNQIYKALSTSAIYGPNAAGKSSIISALDTLDKIIRRGDIRNSVNSGMFDNVAANNLELIPNKDYKTSEPVYFSISFIHFDKLFTYELKLDLGIFLEVHAKRRVIFEQLVINNKVEFSRSEQGIITAASVPAKLIKTLEDNLNEEELFLTGGYKTIVNNQVYNEFISFFTTKILIFNNSRSEYFTVKIEGPKKAFRNDELSKVAGEIGAFNSDIGMRIKDDSGKGELITFYSSEKNGEKGTIIPSKMVESEGTIRFLNLYPIIKGMLRNGGVLIIDEFELSIHPMILLDIINIFHNDEINTNKTQIIFTTHNPIFLSRSVLRRDEIKLVEKDKAGGSVLYSLADFKTEGVGGVRKTEDYMKNYFIDKYGATIDVNLAEFFKV